MTQTRFSIAIMLACVAATSFAVACNIPVFRYALERWKSDAYEIVISYGDQITTEQMAYVALLEDAATDSGGAANITVRRARIEGATKPELAVKMSMANGRTIVHWRGTIEDAKAANLLESPARTELVKRLLAGDSVVWILLRSHDETKSDAAKRLLLDSFKMLHTKISLPDGIGLPGSELHSEVPLFVKFSLIEIDWNETRETFLSTWLRGFQPDAVEAGEPLAVPVFGRGRALEVIPGPVMNPSLVEDLTMFLSGACSCQVKEQNPGFDLLLRVDWDTELYGPDGLRPPPAKSPGEGERIPRTIAIPPGKTKAK
jgi:hypothetical protein